MKNRHHENFLKLRRNRELPELLSFGYLFNEKTVIHKDAAFSAHFSYIAQDVDSSTGAILDANAYAVFQALGLLDDGWMFETNLLSEEDKKYADAQTFPDTVSALIDDARRFNFEQDQTFFKSTCYLSISYVPTDQLGKKLSKLIVDSEEKTKSIDDEYAYFENTVQRFLTQFQKITNASSGVDNDSIKGLENVELNHLQRLRKDALVTFLHQTITGKQQQLKAPKIGYFLDSYLSSEHFIGGVIPKIGKKWIKVLFIDDLPEYTYPAILDELNYLGFEYRWSSRFIPLSKLTAEKYLKSLKSRWSNKAIGLIGSIKMAMGIAPQIDEAAEERKYQTSQAIKENSSGEARYGFMTSVVILMNEDRTTLEAAANQITKTIETLNFKIRDEAFNATEAYLGSIPGHGCYNIRKPLVDSIYVSHAIPTSSVWQGSRTAPCPFYPKGSPALIYVRTKGSRTFRLNLHVGDVGHFMIIGPTGTGKSTLLGLIGCQFRKYPRSRIVVFDKDYSNRVWLKALGGDYFDVYGGAQFAPLAMLASLQEGTAEFEAEMTFLVEWLCEICELQKVDITPDKKEKVDQSLRALVKSGKENLRLDLLHIQDQEIRQAIDSFNSGAIQKMMNGLNDRLGNNSVIGMEMGELLKLPESIYIPIVRAIFHRLTRLFQDRKPTILILEEAWSFLRHKIFENMLEDWLLTLRKFNVAVGFISQNIEHVTSSRISGTIKESCPTKFYLPNHNIYDESVAKKYLEFGLNEQQVAMIGLAVPKRDYYLTSPIGNRLIQLDLDPLSLAFLGVSKEKDVQKFKETHRDDDERWILDWLDYKGLTQWREFAEKCYFQGDNHA
ncbi:MAG: hypothetical protein COV52_09760 [Gammaproteobacteria bacterium CG11_big_fil_rev_8_21_14_0_20_46_22]|nr:MAG: hypothetical protein COV52_09760 [Gammaproteobacteria bacterium CG11_big_fil_rev_8_21_14_0_20_46_22]